MGNPENLGSIEKFVANLAAYYKENSKIVSDLLLNWVKRQNKSDKELNEIFQQILENETWFPKITEIRKYFNQEIDASKAYQIACDAALKYGSRNIIFANNRISQTIKRGWGSWENFCKDEQDAHFRFKFFCDIFNHTQKSSDIILLSGLYNEDEIVLIKDGSDKYLIDGSLKFISEKKEQLKEDKSLLILSNVIKKIDED